MAGTTSRGFPYPHDTDPINVAVDIQRLAEAINTDITNNSGSASNQDAAQNAAIVALNQSLAGNTNQDAVDRERMEAINTAMVANDNSHQASINSLNSSVNTLQSRTPASKVYGELKAVTCDAFGYAEVFYPGGMFGAGQSPIPVVGVANNDPAQWIHAAIWGTATHGFGCFFQRNNTAMAGSSIIIYYHAIGPWP